MRIDTIENALERSGEASAVETAGYVIGYAVARDQIDNGLLCVAECVNPLRITRDAWRDVAFERGAWLLDVEVVCSDSTRHRERVERRAADIAGLALPTWKQVTARVYEPWDRERLVIDTAVTDIESAVEIVRLRAVALANC